MTTDEFVRHRPSFAMIHLDRVYENFRIMRSLVAGGAFFCPMVKADAYGHGQNEVARALRTAGATHLGVALIEEGLKLRDSGDSGGVLVFGLFSDRESANAIVQANLTPVISDWSQLEALTHAASKTLRKPLKIHIKFDTGMSRLGFDGKEAVKLREWLNSHPEFQLAGVCTHLFRGEDAARADGDSQTQLKNLTQILPAFRGLSFHVHALNSSACAALKTPGSAGLPEALREFGPLGARPGISIYGIEPLADSQLGLEPVMSLRTRPALVKRIAAGERVSYGGTWKAARESVIGVIPIGYGDGYFRALSNRGSILCRGRRAPIAGTVCMDYFMVDLTDVQTLTSATQGPITIADEIVLIGEQNGASIRASELAELCDTIPYEVLTRVGGRVPRTYSPLVALGVPKASGSLADHGQRKSQRVSLK